VNRELPDEDLFSAYREGTCKSAPPQLVRAIRDRLSRSRLVLPKVAFACLSSSVGLAAVTTFLLTSGDLSPRKSASEPPPMFQGLQNDLFSDAVSLRPE